MSASVVFPIDRLADLLIEKGGVPVSPETKYNALTAGSTNNLILAGVASKRIRLLSLIGSSQTGTATSISLLDGSGGTVIALITIPANSSAEPNVILDLSKYGWADTTSGTGLYVNCSAAAGVYLSTRLAQYSV